MTACCQLRENWRGTPAAWWSTKWHNNSKFLHYQMCLKPLKTGGGGQWHYPQIWEAVCCLYINIVVHKYIFTTQPALMEQGKILSSKTVLSYTEGFSFTLVTSSVWRQSISSICALQPELCALRATFTHSRRAVWILCNKHQTVVK